MSTISKPQTLKASTSQEAFDKMVKHLFKLDGRAMDGSSCTYYDPDTKKRCAVGALISVGKLSGLHRRTSVQELVLQQVLFVPHGVSVSLLQSVQAVHDGSDYWQHGRPNDHALTRLRDIARAYRLDTTVLDKAAAKAGVAS